SIPICPSVVNSWRNGYRTKTKTGSNFSQIRSTKSLHYKVLDKLVHWHLLQLFHVLKQLQNSSAAFCVKTSGEIFLKLLHKKRNSLGATVAVADGIFDLDFFSRCSIRKEDLDGVGNRTFVRLEIFAGVARIFADSHSVTKDVNSWVFGGRIFVMI